MTESAAEKAGPYCVKRSHRDVGGWTLHGPTGKTVYEIFHEDLAREIALTSNQAYAAGREEVWREVHFHLANLGNFATDGRNWKQMIAALVGNAEIKGRASGLAEGKKSRDGLRKALERIRDIEEPTLAKASGSNSNVTYCIAGEALAQDDAA